jgi:hypothetical protein
MFLLSTHSLTGTSKLCRTVVFVTVLELFIEKLYVQRVCKDIYVPIFIVEPDSDLQQCGELQFLYCSGTFFS